MTNHNVIKQFLMERIIAKAEKFNSTLSKKDIGDDFSFTNSGYFDSMDFMNLIVEVEDKFKVGIDFSEKEPSVFTTLIGFINCIRS